MTVWFKSFFTISFIWASVNLSLGQQLKLIGKVLDQKSNPLFAVNIFVKGNTTIGVITDFEGYFEMNIPIENLKDTLQLSYIGFENQFVPIATLVNNKNVSLVLKESLDLLKEVIITANDPITDEFSVVKLSRLDIYRNPIAAADPLRAIAILPASTNTDESANVELRGSSSGRSAVIVNNVPIRNPVRNSQINGIGNFSIFNNEIVDQQRVYASNPPLTFGNSSAGLVEITTRQKISTNNLQLSAGLGNAGFFLNAHKKEVDFLQLYGNYQFSSLFTGLNGDNIENLNRFETIDLGVNIHKSFNDKISLNLYSYGINESANVDQHSLNFDGTFFTERIRNFNIINSVFRFNSSILQLNHGSDFIRSDFDFGVIQSNQKSEEFYSSVDYRYLIGDSFSLQGGLSHNIFRIDFDDQQPELFFALAPESPSTTLDTLIRNEVLESYLYGKLNIPLFIIAAGLRKNIPLADQENYLSFQGSVRFNPFKDHSFLISGGRYHNFGTPNAILPVQRLLSSEQFAFEYTFSISDFNIQLSNFIKKEEGNLLLREDDEVVELNSVEISGVEIGLTKTWFKFINTSFAYTYLDSNEIIDGESNRRSNDLNYIIKFSIGYNNPKIITASLNYITRAGTYYTPVVDAIFSEDVQAYEPLFDQNRNSAQFPNYQALNLSFNKSFKVLGSRVISYLTVTNLLNRDNPIAAIYNSDFSVENFDNLQKRTIYFGAVIDLSL
ncbi:MAG: TonB-dependent receptor [Bacteroidota bacterium]